MAKLKIAVLAGGLSNEREVSFWTAENIIAALPKEKYEVRTVEINPDNKWIAELQPAKAADKPDLAFIALHGKFGEDGKIQALLEFLNIKYTGSGVTASALAFDKIKCHQFLHGYGLAAPKFIALNKMPHDLSEVGKLVHEHIAFPCVVKPNESGSSVGVTLVKDPTRLAEALQAAFKEDANVIIQQYIKGRELTCGVLGNAGQTAITVLPPVEIIPHTDFFDYQEKYKASGNEFCPANIPEELTKKLQELSKIAHEAIGARGLTRSDFIYANGQFFFLEINTLPGLAKPSLVPKEAAASGMNYAELLEKIIALALSK